jgi:signal transduction histidine kinase
MFYSFELHDGELAITSDSQGTCLSIKLPIAVGFKLIQI